MSSGHKILACCLATMLFASAATGQDRQELEHHLQSDYVGKYWLIRGFYGGADLRFDSAGKLLKGKPLESWTLAGVKIAKLKFRNGSLEISGDRVAYVYDSMKGQFSHQTFAKVRIKLDVANPSNEAAIRQVLEGIFLSGSAIPESGVPEYWHDFLAHGEQPFTKPEPGSVVGELSDGEKVYVAGKEVKAPHPIYTPDPEYSQAAQQAHFQGTLELRMVIDKTGHTTKIRIVRPIGFGLDDKAVDAVKMWRFEPATRNGEPVEVQMNVTTGFRLY